MMKEKTIRFPDYKSVAGQRFALGSLKENDLRLRICNTNEVECWEYTKILEQEGFVRQIQKKIPSNSEYLEGFNLFFLYIKGNLRVYVFWDFSIKTVFITAEENTDLPCFDTEEKKYQKHNSVKVTQLSIAMGMFYVITITDGSFICIDGGISREEDLVKAFDFFIENSDKKPIISAWYFTHSHVDHIELATDFIKKYGDKIEIKSFVYQFPDCDKVTVSMEDVKKEQEGIDRLETAIKTVCKSAKVYTAHTGQSFYYGDAEIEILYSPDNTYPYPYFSFNELSLVFRLKVKNGKSVLFMGDCMCDGCRNIAHTYGDYLKSDILQVAHHGLIGGDVYLYKFVNPTICLWATPESRFNGELKGQKFQWCKGEGGCEYNSFLRDDSILKRQHYCLGKNVTLEL